ncbi:hypothetical protein JJJ17_07740 [Paracoccus caeni]|uniref:Tip attachment protein J domain-containing protein n=1 Tax=Paracoccus caeni TaxID=657651 RepID=A0A934SI52_9RHOB|nr:hypothetical protein [Paracoccus caeni]MBK4215812.1 hypothetical protein [Paracoccus caeni]
MAVFTLINTFATWALGPGSLQLFGLSVKATAAVVSVGRSVLWSLAGTSLNRPNIPRQQVMATLSQTDSPRIRAYGRNLLGGVRAFHEAAEGELFQLVVMNHGQVDGLIRFWWDGEPVITDANGRVGRYKRNYFRDGSGNGGDYSDIPARNLSLFPELWTSEHRLQGQATFLAIFGDPADEDFAKEFPKGPHTQVQAEIRGVRVRNMSNSLVYSDSASLCIRNLMTHRDGWNIPLSKLDDASWAAFTARCSEPVALKGGGTEPRYRLSGYYTLDDPLKDVTARMLATCDGQVYETAEGKVGILGGGWSEPDVTITSADILSIEMDDGFDPFTDYNVLQGSFVSPDHGYQPTPVPDHKDAAVIGDQPERNQAYDNDMCPSGTQLQRLMKIRYAKDHRDQVGTIRTNLVGLKARFPKGDGIHTIRLQAPEFGIDGVYEVTSHSFSVADGVCVIGIASLQNPYGWNAATEERPLPPTLAEIAKNTQQVPEITGIALTQQLVDISGDVTGVKLSVTVDDPNRPSLKLKAQVAKGNYTAVGPWPDPQPKWIEMPADDYRAETGILDDGEQFTVRIQWVGRGNWVKAGTVTIVADPVRPDAPGSFGVMVTGGNAYLDWINAATNYFRTRVYVGTSPSFGAATLVATVAGNAGRPDSYTYDAGGGTGLRYFWVCTVNRSGLESLPDTPVSVVF